MWRTGLVAPRHVGSSQTRARARVPCIGRQTLNHCPTREAQQSRIFKIGVPSMTTMRCSLLKPPVNSEHGGSTISKACSQCPNTATRTTAKRRCSLVPALRLNLAAPCCHASRRLTTTRVRPGNRTCHLTVSCSPGIPLPMGLGRFLPLPLAASPTQVAHERRAASERTGVFVSKCRCLTLTPAAQKQNQWGWGLGTCILSRSSVDSCAHENLRNIRPEP